MTDGVTSIPPGVGSAARARPRRFGRGAGAFSAASPPGSALESCGFRHPVIEEVVAEADQPHPRVEPAAVELAGEVDDAVADSRRSRSPCSPVTSSTNMTSTFNSGGL